MGFTIYFLFNIFTIILAFVLTNKLLKIIEREEE
jgi:hypothetical protein